MKVTKKTETKVTGVTLELTVEEATRLMIIMGELETDGHGTVLKVALVPDGKPDPLPSFGYVLFNALDRELLR